MTTWPWITPMGAAFILLCVCVFVGIWAYNAHKKEMEQHEYWVRRTQEMLDIMYMGTEFGKPYDWSKEAEQDLIKKGESNV